MCFASGLIVAIFSTLLWAVVAGDGWLFWVTATAIVMSGVLSVLAWRTIRYSVIAHADSASELESVRWRQMLSALLLVGVAQVVYTISCLGAIFCKTVRWRGVEYQVVKGGVKLVEYLPYSSASQSDQSI